MVTFVELPKSGEFFRPRDYADAVAIVVEPKRMERQRPSKFGPQDIIHADLTVFRSQDDVSAGAPLEMPNAKVSGTALVRDLEALVGNATVVRLRQMEGSQGRSDFYVWDSAVDSAARKGAVEFVQAREATHEEAKSSGDMPDFLS